MVSNLKSLCVKYLATRFRTTELNGLRRCWRAILKRRRMFVFAASANVAMAFFEGGSIAILGIAVAVVTGGTLPGNILDKFVEYIELVIGSLDRGDLFIVLVVVAVLMQVIRSVLSYLGSITGQYLVTQVRSDLTVEATKHTMAMSYSSLSSYPAGQVVAVVEQTKVLALLVGQVIKGIRVSVLLLAYGSLIVITSPYSGIVILLVIALLWFSVSGIVKKLRDAAKREVQGESDFWKRTVEYLNAPKMLRSLNATDVAAKRIGEARKRQLLSVNRGNTVQAIVDPVIEVVVILGIGFTIIGGYLYFAETAVERISTLFIYMLVILRIKPQITALNQIRLRTSRSLPRIGFIEQYFSSEGKTFQRTGGKEIRELEGGISFQSVSFSYGSAENGALKDISFDLQKGKTVALVGESGSGKTTIVDLLLGLYEPNTGSIMIDGHALSEINLNQWRDLIGTVDQDIFLLNDSISENISFARTNASKDSIVCAAKLAGAHQFIEQTKHGYDTNIGDRGYRLSGGQKQRIGLARALLRDPQLLLLDEATSALDVESEREIQNSIESMRGEKTMLIVAHRLSTIVNSDLIVVLDKGRIVEKGAMSDLLAKNSYFKKFWDTQKT